MALDKDKFVDSLIAIQQKKKQIAQLNTDRTEAEKGFVIDKKINELNAQRTALNKSYDDQITQLIQEIKTLEDSLGQV